MKVDIDGEIYEVHLCDEHADNTTMGKVTKKVREIKEKLQNAVSLAIDLGIKIKINSCGDKMPDLNIIPSDKPNTPTDTTPENDKPVQENSKMIIRAPTKIKLSEGVEVPRDDKLEMQEIEAKGGKISIPKRTEGAAGTTEIRIVNTRDDQLQKRFKNLKQAGEGGRTPPTGYLQDCLACHGTGTNPVLKNDCQKCGGTGVKQ